VQRIAGPKRKKPKPISAADRLSAIAKHQRQITGPIPSLDITPRIRAFDLTVNRLSEEVRRLAQEWKFNVASICAEIERRASNP
jgi:hypothetical protein